jgi:hypothetical protein
VKRLIVNADDLGYDPAVTDGIVKAMREGLVTSCTFMVNTPYSEDAVRGGHGLAVGLHLNLARWRPLSGAIPAELLKDGELDERRAAELPAKAVEQETLAQLDRLQQLLSQPATHLDVHKHLHRHPAVLEGVIAAAKARSLPVRSINAEMRRTLAAAGVKTTDHFIGEAGTEPYWSLERLRTELEALPEGTTELMCHPGYMPTHVRSGYSRQREVELQTFLHMGAQAVVERLGIQLVDFRAL